jgi:hypothetical protein
MKGVTEAFTETCSVSLFLRMLVHLTWVSRTAVAPGEPLGAGVLDDERFFT